MKQQYLFLLSLIMIIVMITGCPAGSDGGSSSSDGDDTSSSGDTTCPTSGNTGTLTTSSVVNTSLVLNWTAATDNSSAQANLQYLAYCSTADNISSVADCEANGTAVGSYEANIIKKTAAGLSPSTTYYFNVIVKDEAGNKALYTTLTQATSGAADTANPTPGNGGTITAASVTDTSMTLNWTAASDNTSAQADLQYLAYSSSSNNISTVADCEANGLAIGSYAENITTLNLGGLTASTTYYFNVIVKDISGNKAIYSTLTKTTAAEPDTTNPTPGNSGTITASSVAENTLTLNWTAATDNTTAQADLQYLAYGSISNNISTVADCEANGLAIGSYAANITTKDVTGLAGSTTYYFNVIVKDTSGNKEIYSTLTQATTADTTNPTAGNSGTITASSVTGTTLTLNWTAATDNTSAQADLQYLAYSSTANNISTVADCEANGAAIDSYAANITTKNVSGLSGSTTYYFNVIVKDEAGNKAIYSTLTQATSDTTNPTPGNSGTITTSGVADTTLTLNWTAATDNASAQANLQYLAYSSSANNISTVADCEANGAPIGSYAANITTKNVTGLTASTNYYFNVIVKDEAGNKAIYSALSQTTAAASSIPTDYIFRWKLNNNENDETASHHLSNITGAPVYSTTSPKEGTHYLSVDENDTIYSSAYNITTDAISISVWIYVNSSLAGNFPCIIDIGGLGIFFDNASGRIKGVPGSSFVQTNPIVTNTWYHIVLTYDSTTNAIIYRNSVAEEDWAISGNITNINAPWYIGSKSGSDFWNGYIDDVIVYDRQLTADEVTNIYNSY